MAKKSKAQDKEKENTESKAQEEVKNTLESKGKEESKLKADLKKKISEVQEEVKGKMKSNFTKELADIGYDAAKALTLSPVKAGEMVFELGKAAVNSALSMEDAMNSFAASTGKSKEETGRYQAVLENIYKNNYGADFQDIADAMSNVTKRMGDMDDLTLQEVTESAFLLRDTFAYDIADSTDAAKALMDNFGTSGESAMSLIAAGAQHGLDNNGKLLDSIAKYSGEFSKVGLNADEMFHIFQEGAETGTFSIETIGSAMGEMSTRILEGSDSAKEGFERIGLNADEVTAKFAEGGDSAREAFQQTMDALAAMEDPLEQSMAGADLFGSAWEEMGPEVVEQLSGITEGAYDTADAINGMKETKDDNLSNMFGELQRSVEMLLVPLGEALIPILSELVKSFMPIVEAMMPLVQLIMDLLIPVVQILAQVVSKVFTKIAEFIMKKVVTIKKSLEPMIKLFKALAKGVSILFGKKVDVSSEVGESEGDIPKLRVGMEYVPEDDFPALLHKGEAVLTAQENVVYRSVGGFEGIQQQLSRSAGNGDVYVNVNSSGDEEMIDYGKMGQATASAIQKAGLSVRIGEREFGRIVREV